MESDKNAKTRVTVYLKPEFHKALKVKSAKTGNSVSDLINSAIEAALIEDAIDLEAIEKRADEPSIAFDSFLQALKQSGKIKDKKKIRRREVYR